MKGGVALALFLQAYLGHLLGDFVFQPGRLVLAKRRGPVGMIVHTTILTGCTALMVLGDLAKLWPAVLAAGAAHFGIEHLTVRARRTTDASGLRLFLLDQALHIVSLVLVAFVFGEGVESALIVWPLPLATVAGICAIATAAFLGSILAFEVRVAVLGADTPSEPILRLDVARLYGMAERGGALALAMLSPTPPLGVLVFVPRMVFAYTRPTRVRAAIAIDAAVGLILCAAAWFAVALLVGLNT